MPTMPEAGTANPARLEPALEKLSLEEAGGEWSNRYLLGNFLVDPALASDRKRFEGLARYVRDLLADRWVKTRQARERANPKRVYYLSMEFLIGRTLRNNIMNLAAEPMVRRIMAREGWYLDELIEEEPDAGLGNGGLGRLAACFIDSLATLQYPAIGYGLRYEYGIFRQSIRDGYQVEHPDNWLRQADPWEILRAGKRLCGPAERHPSSCVGSTVRILPNRPSTLLGIAYDRPVVGYGARFVNTLRLWAAAAPESFDFAEFSHGDFVGAVIQNVAAESLTRVLYPDDSTEAGRTLRFLQQYFMVSCSLQDIVMRFRQAGEPGWSRSAGPRRDPDERHASGALGGRADADPARPGAPRLGRGLGPDACARWPTPITRCCPRPWRSGRSSCSRISCPGTWRSSTRSIAASSTTCGAATRRPSRMRRMSLIEEGAGREECAWLISRSSARTAPTAWPQSIRTCSATHVLQRLRRDVSRSASTTRPTA